MSGGAPRSPSLSRCVPARRRSLAGMWLLPLAEKKTLRFPTFSHPTHAGAPPRRGAHPSSIKATITIELTTISGTTHAAHGAQQRRQQHKHQRANQGASVMAVER